MIKKLSLLAMAVGALVAFAIPATASAKAILYEEHDMGVITELQPGAEITATSVDLETTTVNGTLFCEEVTIHGTVGENTTASATIVQNEVTVSDVCEITENGTPVTITNPSVGTVTINADGTGSAANATFISDIQIAIGPPPVYLPCHFEGDLDFTYETDDDVITLPEGAGPNLAGTSGEPCPSAGEMHGSFTLETEDGTPVKIA